MVESSLVQQFLQHRHAILTYIHALTRDRDITEEVFQEVGLAISQHAQQGTRVERFLAWALEIARRQTAAYFRSHQRRKQMVVFSEALADSLTEVFQENERLMEEDQHRYTLLHECLEQLRGRSREIIKQRYRLGRPLSAIASSLQWKVESVKVALSRARKQLLECVQRKLQSEGM